MKIVGISIKNFRSIVNAEISTGKLNVYVGLNDSGKSNILKALNLFFNGETEINKRFDFDIDYSKFAKKIAKKADEVTVRIKFEVPDGFVDSGIVIWTKKWRKNGLEHDVFAKDDRTEFAARSKVKTAILRTKFRYVPAVKSEAYFHTLLETLYKSRFMEKNKEFDEAANNYSLALVENTKGISDIVKTNLGIDSILKVPPNQSEIFKALKFETVENGNNTINLDYRGDGIKSRHIPAILKFIVDHECLYREPYTISGETIWGYEEPENGVELAKCYDMAEEFADYSDKIQILITTHSPAFYNLKNKGDSVKTFFVSKSNATGETKVGSIESHNVNEEMGIMPLIEPYISEHISEIKKLRNLINDTGLIDVDTIFVEGKTDIKYLNKAFELLSPDLFGRIECGTLKIFTKEGRGGCNSLSDWIVAWSHTKHTSKAIGLFDNDSAGRTAKKDLNKMLSSCKRNSNYPLKVITIPYTGQMKTMLRDIEINFSIEHLFPCWVWKKYEKYTSEIEEQYFAKLRNIPRDISYDCHLESLVPDEDNRYLINRSVLKDHKVSFCEEVLKESEDNPEIFADFKELIVELAEFFLDAV